METQSTRIWLRNTGRNCLDCTRLDRYRPARARFFCAAASPPGCATLLGCVKLNRTEPVVVRNDANEAARLCLEQAYVCTSYTVAVTFLRDVGNNCEVAKCGNLSSNSSYKFLFECEEIV
jgi:hypothetical protein